MESDRMTKRIHPASGILLGIQETGPEIPTYSLTFLSGFRGSAGRRIGNLFTFVILFVLLGWGASLQAQGSNARGYTASTMVTLAIPPPSHIVCKPYRLPRIRRACTNVAMSLVPLAPSG